MWRQWLCLWLYLLKFWLDLRRLPLRLLYQFLLLGGNYRLDFRYRRWLFDFWWRLYFRYRL
jgi:hypothetical protein